MPEPRQHRDHLRGKTVDDRGVPRIVTEIGEREHGYSRQGVAVTDERQYGQRYLARRLRRGCIARQEVSHTADQYEADDRRREERRSRHPPTLLKHVARVRPGGFELREQLLRALGPRGRARPETSCHELR